MNNDKKDDDPNPSDVKRSFLSRFRASEPSSIKGKYIYCPECGYKMVAGTIVCTICKTELVDFKSFL